jgi:acyl-CoA synthetase (AMP-forming)/AMP-acid ligase II
VFAPGTIGARIDDAAAAMGDRPLLVAGADLRSAREVAAGMRAHARAIAAVTAPGDRVGLRATMDVDTTVLLLGIMAAGRVAVPLDPREPPERLGALLDLADPALRCCAGPVPDGPWSAWPAPVAGDDLGPDVGAVGGATPDDPALLLFTSGTTGRPKGILRTHRMLGTEGDHQASLWAVASAVRVANPYSPAFLGGVLAVLASVAHAAPCHLLDVAALGPEALVATLHAERITVHLSVPSLLRVVCDHARARGIDLPELAVLAFGGEAVTAADLRLMRSVAPRAQLLNCYGAQEAGTAAFHDVAEIHDDTLVPAGRPYFDSRILVVDGTTEVPVGTVGEVLLAGPRVSIGYWRDPEASAAAFTEIGGIPAVRTGDLGRLRPDGVLEIVGRTDHRVKVRGQGVDLLEVEAALRADPTVAAAAVSSLPDPRSGIRLVAHVVGHPDADPATHPDPATIRRALRDRMPGYTVPGTVLVTDALPLTVRGKVDRAALHELARSAPPPPRGLDPRTPTETAIRDLMAEILGIDPDDLGCDDDFAAHGGDSLRALELLEAILTTHDPGPDTVLALETCLAHLPTAETLARILDPSDPTDPSEQSGQSGAPTTGGDPGDAALLPRRPPPHPLAPRVYVLPGAGHHPLTLRPLADRLPDTFLATFVPRGVAAPAWPDRSVAALARRYGDLVRADLARCATPSAGARPAGTRPAGTRLAETPPAEPPPDPGGRPPVALVGYSFGAVVAFETARRLRATGVPVDLLVVVDAPPHHRRHLPNPTVRRRVAAATLATVADLRARLAPLVMRTSRDDTRRNLAQFTYCGRLARRHRPAPGPGDVLVVRATHNPDPDPDLAWSTVATGTVRTVEVDATHDTILRPPAVDALADALRSALRATGADRPAATA